MERINRIDQPQERAVNPSRKAKKAGLPPWIAKPYELQQLAEELKAPNSNPRLEVLQRISGLHQDSNVIPSGEDYGYAPPVFGAKPDLNARASSASNQGILAGYDPNRPINAFFADRLSDPQHNRPRDLSDLRNSESQLHSMGSYASSPSSSYSSS
jgi:hypothetical protein